MKDLKISDKKKNVTDKDKGGQKSYLTTENTTETSEKNATSSEKTIKVRELDGQPRK